jgi:hypothetical protein
VLDNADEPSSLAASLSVAVELLEGWVDFMAANGVRWGTRSALVAALSHFSKLDTELELLESGRNTDLTEIRWMPCGPVCTRPRTRWCRTSFLRLLVALLMARGSSSGGSLGH